MRHVVLASLVWTAALALPAVARADVKIADIQVGFPGGGGQGKFKNGSWIPIYVTLSNESDTPISAECKLIVETVDGDDVPNQYTRKLGTDLPAGGGDTLVTYTRVCNMAMDIVVTLKTPDDQTLASGKALSSTFQALDPGQVLYLTLGAPLADLQQAVDTARDPNTKDRKIEFVSLDSVSKLPDRWYGYQGIDLILLTTSRESWVSDLRKAGKRLEALAEWVRRGGRLVISLGGSKHTELRARVLQELKLIDCELLAGKPAAWKRLDTVEMWAGGVHTAPFVGVAKGNEPRPQIETAWLQPGHPAARGIDVLVEQPREENPKPDPYDRPLVIQAPCGEGRVLLTAFDLDEAPFTAWADCNAFWKKLNDIIGTKPYDAPAMTAGAFSSTGSRELVSQLQDGLETFDDVPVISFGWVALFIILYIIVVGPLEFYILFKVVKRPELTWIVFPTVVITLSVIAYAAAYWLKGNDLRINKVDVVDLVAEPEADNSQCRTTTAYGTTWFTLFSPHIKHYTVAVEPGWPTWAPERHADADNPNPYGTLMNAMSRPENSFGAGRQGSGGLFRRAYEYEPDGAALTGVPIQVWSTKSFTASWKADLPRGEAHGLSARLSPGDGGRIKGWVQNDLGVDLQDVVVLYGEKTSLPKSLPAGQRLDVDLTASGNDRGAWFRETFGKQNFKQPDAAKRTGQYIMPPGMLIKPILFYNWDPNKNSHNGGLQYLDQSWRVTDEQRRQQAVVLFARTAPREGKAEDITKDGVSATRLWLDELPSSGKSRPAMSGTLSQETYIRVYIPIMK